MTTPQPYDAPRILARVPEAPRAPSSRARRVVFRYQGTQRAFVWIGCAFLGIGGVLTTVFAWGLPIDLAIALTERHATGTVESTRLDPSVKINGSHPTIVAYVFEVDEVRVAGASRTLDPDLARLAPGAEVEIEFARGHPRWSRLAGTTYAIFGPWALFVLLFPGLGALLVGAAVRSNRREIRAFTHGVPVLARVTQRGFDHATRINGRHPYRVAWEFRIDETRHAGSISSLDEREFDDLAQTESVVVLHDARDPRVNTLFLE